MKNWNIHSMWIIGILLAVLIGSTSVDWNAIKDLPGIISFAVGLSSLILAVIAIFQTLSSTGSVEASLAAVREATTSSAQVSSELAASTAIIQQAAIDAQAASSSAMAATGNFVNISASILESNEAGRQAVAKLREEISSKSIGAPTRSAITTPSPANKFVRSSLGGVSTTYAALRGLEKNRSFKLSEIFVDDKSLGFELGYMSALDDAGFINFIYEDGIYTMKSANFVDIKEEMQRLKSSHFDGDPQTKHIKRIAQIDAFFDVENGVSKGGDGDPA